MSDRNIMVVDMAIEDLHWRELIFDVYLTHKKLHFASDHSKLELARNVSIKRLKSNQL